IGVQPSAEFNVVQDFVLQRFTPDVRNDLAANLASVPIKHSMNTGLAEVNISKPVLTANRGKFDTTIFVHLAGVRPDEGLIAFHGSASTTEFCHGIVLDDFADSVKHEPSRLLGDLESPRHLCAADSVLAVDHHPEGGHPFVHTERRVLKDGSDFHAELFLASLAPPHKPRANKRVFIAAASWTGYLLSRPAQIDCVHENTLGIGEISNRFLQGFGLFDVRHFFALSFYLMRE